MGLRDPLSTTRAVLVDVFDTMFSVDVGAVSAAMTDLSGLSREDFREGVRACFVRTMNGDLTMREAFAATYFLAGREVGDVGALVEADRQLMRRHARVYADTVPFLESVRERGLRIAFVSNCSDNTRPLLEDLGLAAFADELVLSCEVRAAKPDARIYRRALEALDVSASQALMIDDQAGFCAGAEAVGVNAVRISRSGPREGAVETLTEVLQLLV